MSTVIWYDAKRQNYYVSTTPGMHWSGVTRAECIESNSLGLTSEDLDRAEASPGKWIVCPREPQIVTSDARIDWIKQIRSVENLGDASEVMAGLRADLVAVTAQRDWLLKACKTLRTRVATLEDPGCRWSDFLDADDVDAAIVDVEKSTP